LSTALAVGKEVELKSLLRFGVELKVTCVMLKSFVSDIPQ